MARHGNKLTMDVTLKDRDGLVAAFERGGETFQRLTAQLNATQETLDAVRAELARLREHLDAVRFDARRSPADAENGADDDHG